MVTVVEDFFRLLREHIIMMTTRLSQGTTLGQVKPASRSVMAALSQHLSSVGPHGGM